MKSLFSTAAEDLEPELQAIRSLLWSRWESDPLEKRTWLKHIELAGGTEAGKVFETFVEVGVLVKVGGGFKLDKDA